tara:strand:+ start:483 stop:764 length:282 start_codon:yes stop_codon:yes gene_type:complete
MTLDEIKRAIVATDSRTGQTTVDGVEVGRVLWIGRVHKHFTKEEDVVIRASSAEEFQERVDEMMCAEAKQKGFEPGLLSIDFSMPKREFDVKG